MYGFWHQKVALKSIILGLALMAGWVDAQNPRGYRGEWNSWGYSAMALDLGVWRVTVQAGSGSGFKLAHDDWDHEWTHGGNVPLGTIVVANTGGGNSSLSATSGRHYTFTMNNVNYGVQGVMLVQETTSAPVNITGVSHHLNGTNVVINITTSATPSSGEKIYVRYSLNNWSSSSFVQATGSGTSWSATIHHGLGDVGLDNDYYVLTTTVATPTHADANLQSIRWNNNSGSNYSYEVDDEPTPIETPTVQASNIQFPGVTHSSVTLSWTRGDGDRVRVFAREGSPVNSHPVDGEGYGANSVFGEGHELGSGNYLVYTGSDASTTVTGLSPETTYHFRIYEFNGTGSTSTYNTNTASGNPASTTTVATPPYSIFVNEVMASNSGLIQDDDGDYPDWVELYNAGDDPVNLLGWGLSDNDTNPFKWRFGDVTIGAGQFLVVWASNKDRTNGPNPHTSWAVSAAGEPITLNDPEGVLVDEMESIPIPTNLSYGRQPDGTENWVFFNQPTPGASNTTDPYELVESPTFSHPGGFYTSTIQVSMSTDVDGGVIRYTTDGSEPTASSPVYSSAISLSSRVGQGNVYSTIPTNNRDVSYDGWQAPNGEVFKIHVLRAKVFTPSGGQSRATTHSYLVDAAGVNRYSLPVVSIATAPSNLFSNATGIYVHGNSGSPFNYEQTGSDWERPANLEFFEADGSLGFSAEVGLRIHGNQSRHRPRKTFRVYARNPDGANVINYQFFPEKDVSNFSTFLLRNGGNDWGQTIIRDDLGALLVANTGLDRMATRPVVVFVDGEYWGVHTVRDRIDDNYYEHHYGLSSEEFTQVEVHDAPSLPVLDGGNPSLLADFQDIMYRASNNLYASPASFEEIEDRIDVDNYIDYNIHQIFAANGDWPGNNTRLWRSVASNRAPGAPYRHDGRWRWIFFDLDMGYGYDAGYVPGHNSDVNLHAAFDMMAYATSTEQTHFSNHPNGTLLLRRLLVNPIFKQRFVTRFADALNTTLSVTHTTNVLGSVQAELASSMTEHANRWVKPGNWNSEMTRARTFLQLRPNAVWGHVADNLNLGPRHDVTIEVNDTEKGSVMVNSVHLTPETPGVTGYPWTGSYFSDYPITLTAVPVAGQQFVEWVATTSSYNTVASDNANNYGSWNNGSSGGSGFGNWTLETTSGNSNQNGHFLASGSPNYWGLYANSGQEANARRSLNSSLAVGQTFSTRIRHDGIDNGGSVGVSLQNSSNQSLWEFYFVGGETHYRMNGSATSIGYTTSDIDIEVTLTSATAYSAKVTAGASTYTITGNLISQGNQTVSRFRAWNYNAGAENNLYVQNLSVSSLVQGSPTTVSTNDTIEVSVTGDSQYQAVFEAAPFEEDNSVLVHYWSFNDTENLLPPNYSLVSGAGITVDPGPITAVLAGTLNDFAGENARFDDEAGAHLRVNDPIGATMDIALPTTGFEDIVVMYETRRSGSGAGTQIVEYSLNGSTWTTIDTLAVTEIPTLHTFDFTAISGANNNPNFALRVTFEQGAGGAVGNNRFDNLTLEGEPLGELNLPPEVDESIAFQELIQGATGPNFNLNNVFSDPENDTLTFGATASNTNVVSVQVSGSTLTVTPLLRGDSTVQVTADDGSNPPVQTSFRVLVYPNAFALEGEEYAFNEWDEAEPAGHFPPHMIFLQGEGNDSAIDTDLLHAYSIDGDTDATTNNAALPYAAGSRTRINGLGEDGIAFINTGRGRDLGGALLAIDTRNVEDATLSWVGGTVLANVRVYAIRLQYRIGTSGAFEDVLDGSSNPIEYVRNGDTGHSETLGPVLLPEALLDEEYVQLLWRYYLVEGASGARAQLRVDDISVVDATEGVNLPPEVDAPIAFQELIEGAVAAQFNLTNVFSDPEEDVLTFLASSSNTNVLSAQVSGSTLTITPLSRGESLVQLTADDGQNPPVPTSFRVLVYPEAHVLANGAFGFDEWDDQEPAGSFPENMIFLQGNQNDSAVDTPLLYAYSIAGDAGVGDSDDLPYAATSRTRLNGLGEDGIAFINTGRGRDLGGAVLALDTRDVDAVPVSWTGGTVLPNTRVYAIRLQYRVGASGPFLDVLDESEQPVEYVRNAAADHSAALGPVLLPAAAVGEEYVQVLWRYYLVSGGSGARAQLRLDDIVVTGESPGSAEALEWISTPPAYALSGLTLPALSVRAIDGDSITDVDFSGPVVVTLNGPGTLTGTRTNNAVNGVATFNDLVITGAGVHTLTSSSGALTPDETSEIIVDLDPIFIPGVTAPWNDAANWTSVDFPNAADTVALINRPASGNRNVDINAPITVGHLTINDADSTFRNRIRGQVEGNSLTFAASSGSASLTINGDETGFVEFEVIGGVVLATNLTITVNNIVGDPEFGALRLRQGWTGPGGLTKAGAGMASLTGEDKLFTGAVLVEQGVLAVTEPSTPVNSAGTTVQPGGQLRLTSGGVDPRTYAFGGTLSLSGSGRSGVGEGEGLGVLGALRYEPGAGDNHAILAGPVAIAVDASIHVATAGNVLELAGDLSGSAEITKSGGGTLIVSSASVTHSGSVDVDNGGLRVEAAWSASLVKVGASAWLEGSGSVQAVQGTGTVVPGPGLEVLTASSVNGLNYQFAFTDSDASILRLTGGTPFVSGLNSANTIDVFLNVAAISENDTFDGAFFTDNEADFIGSIENATWTFYVADELGSVEFNGETYSVYGGEPALSVSTVSSTIDFGSGPVDGRIVRITAEGDAPPTGFDAWRADEFSEAELSNPAISGPLADPDDSGIQNLLRYALGLGRYDAFDDALPTGSVLSSGSVFRHRRLLDSTSGIDYVILTRTGLLTGSWAEAEIGVDILLVGATPTGDGITEIVEYQVPESTLEEPRYFRLEVILQNP